MNSSTFQAFLNSEHDSLLDSVDLFRTLLPHAENDASVHSGEEGRFIELALTQYLRDKLPDGIGIGGGFVVDIENGWNSKQIDILLYDANRFAPIMKYGDAVVLPAESVIAAISVKRTLYLSQLPGEIAALTDIGGRTGGRGYPKPFLAILAFDAKQTDVIKAKDECFNELKNFYKPKLDVKGREQKYSWNELLDAIIVLDQFLIKGSSFTSDNKKSTDASKYLWTGGNTRNRNIYIQQLLRGIHRAWYDERRGNRPIDNLLAIPAGDMQICGRIDLCVLDRKYFWNKFIAAPVTTTAAPTASVQSGALSNTPKSRVRKSKD